MGYMRMNMDRVERNVAPKTFRRPMRKGYIFTQSLWHAMSYLRDGLVTEAGEPDRLDEIFPANVSKALHYGSKFGITHNAVAYNDAQGEPAGVIITVYSGERQLGHYAAKY